jgi:hypothetical protein
MITDGILRLGERQEGIGLSPASLDGHPDVARSSYDDPIAHRLAPGLEHFTTHIRLEVGTAPRVGPDGDACHRLCGHPLRVLPLSSGIEIAAAEGDGNGRDEAAAETFDQRGRSVLGHVSP